MTVLRNSMRSGHTLAWCDDAKCIGTHQSQAATDVELSRQSTRTYPRRWWLVDASTTRRRHRIKSRVGRVLVLSRRQTAESGPGLSLKTSGNKMTSLRAAMCLAVLSGKCQRNLPLNMSSLPSSSESAPTIFGSSRPASRISLATSSRMTLPGGAEIHGYCTHAARSTSFEARGCSGEHARTIPSCTSSTVR